MRRFFSKRNRVVIIIGIVSVICLTNFVRHELSLSTPSASVQRVQAAKRTIYTVRTPQTKRTIYTVPAQQTRRTIYTVSKQQDLVRGHQDTTAKRNDSVLGAQNFTAVIILAYMRSGSSLTGEIMQQHPDVFYVFEPLHMLETSIRAHFHLQFLNGTYIGHDKYKWSDIAIQTLQAWLTCDLENVFERGLFDKRFLNFGKKTAILHQCIEERNPSNRADIFDSTVIYCVKKLREICLASKFRVIKTVRTRMQQIISVMAAVPGVKVIHLVRDPRDTLMSQKMVAACGNATLDELANCTSFYCTHLSEDILFKQEALELKNRVLSVFFEDLALRPLKISSEIYKFVGLEFTKNIQNSIRNLTMLGLKDGCEVCKEPWQNVGNVTLTGLKLIKKWRKKMPKAFRMIVNMLCKESLLYLNYSVDQISFHRKSKYWGR